MASVRPVVAAVVVETVGDDWSKAESDDGTGGCWGRYSEVLARSRRHPSTGTAAGGGICYGG